MASDSKSLQGIWAPALTPLTPTLEPDHDEAAAHIKRLLRQGCHGVVLFGTTGEANSFSVSERCALLDAVVAAGVPTGQLIIGSGCCALGDAIALSRHALAAGCRNLLVLPPFYYKNPRERGLFDYYARLIESLDEDVRVLLYHIPKLSAVPLEGTLVRSLIECYGARIAGFKDSGGVVRDTLQRIRDFPELSVFAGSETALAECAAAGGAGCITATANINAEEIRKAWDLHAKGKPAAAQAQTAIAEVRAVFDQTPMISALKWVIAKRDGNDNWLAVRPPLEPLGILDAETIMQKLQLAPE